MMSSLFCEIIRARVFLLRDCLSAPLFIPTQPLVRTTLRRAFMINRSISDQQKPLFLYRVCINDDSIVPFVSIAYARGFLNSFRVFTFRARFKAGLHRPYS